MRMKLVSRALVLLSFSGENPVLSSCFPSRISIRTLTLLSAVTQGNLLPSLLFLFSHSCLVRLCPYLLFILPLSQTPGIYYDAGNMVLSKKHFLDDHRSKLIQFTNLSLLGWASLGSDLEAFTRCTINIFSNEGSSVLLNVLGTILFKKYFIFYGMNVLPDVCHVPRGYSTCGVQKRD